jgi:hypothetical protein
MSRSGDINTTLPRITDSIWRPSLGSEAVSHGIEGPPSWTNWSCPSSELQHYLHGRDGLQQLCSTYSSSASSVLLYPVTFGKSSMHHISMVSKHHQSTVTHIQEYLQLLIHDTDLFRSFQRQLRDRSQYPHFSRCIVYIELQLFFQNAVHRSNIPAPATSSVESYLSYQQNNHTRTVPNEKNLGTADSGGVAMSTRPFTLDSSQFGTHRRQTDDMPRSEAKLDAAAAMRKNDQLELAGVSSDEDSYDTAPENNLIFIDDEGALFYDAEQTAVIVNAVSTIGQNETSAMLSTPHRMATESTQLEI